MTSKNDAGYGGEYTKWLPANDITNALSGKGHVENPHAHFEGVNVVKRHKRESQGANGRRIEGGIISSEAPIHVSNVQLVTKVDGKEVVTRVGYKRVEVTKRRSDGSEYKALRSKRIARKTGKEI